MNFLVFQNTLIIEALPVTDLAKEAIKDVYHVYTSFSDSVTVALYLMLHTYLCRFFETTRYPEGGEIPRDVIENMTQIINLLKKNLRIPGGYFGR